VADPIAQSYFANPTPPSPSLHRHWIWQPIGSGLRFCDLRAHVVPAGDGFNSRRQRHREPL